MYTEGDIFKIENKEYRLRHINQYGTCWLEPVLLRDECNCFTGGKNKIFHYEQLSNLEYINKRY